MTVLRGRSAVDNARGLGAFCLVLHGHLPWVLHHGRWPHGEEWLWEAAASSWVPMLATLDALHREGVRPAWTVGLTPVLLEQLVHPDFARGFEAWLDDRIAQAKRDRKAFGDLARWHEKRLGDVRRTFRRLRGDLVRGYVRAARRGSIELLTSNATHAFHPLVRQPACARAQVRAGVATSAARLGRRPTAAWLPECAYTPGVGRLYADEDVRLLFVEQSTLERAVPAAYRAPGGRWRRLDVAVPHVGTNDDARAWTSPCEPHVAWETPPGPSAGRAERGGPTVTVLARSGSVSEQVWSADHGYPGDFRYQEFHKRHGDRGLRYWRVTGAKVDLGDKLPYDPAAAMDAVRDQADHFARVVRGRLLEHRGRTGRYGVVCCPFDLELFGHWWAEGPLFLAEVARRLHHEHDVDLLTASEVARRVPADKAVSLPTGTWGAGGDLRTWSSVDWCWEAVGHAEDRFVGLVGRAPWRTDDVVRTYLEAAARELLFLEASDWPFVVSTKGAVDYGVRRIGDHAARFDQLCNAVDDRLAGRAVDPVGEASLALARATDGAFPDLDLGWWS